MELKVLKPKAGQHDRWGGNNKEQAGGDETVGWTLMNSISLVH